jgi:Dienelactone hydrolase family
MIGWFYLDKPISGSANNSKVMRSRDRLGKFTHQWFAKNCVRYKQLPFQIGQDSRRFGKTPDEHFKSRAMKTNRIRHCSRNATIPKAEELMRAAGKKYEPVIYEGAGHGFMRCGEPANPSVRDGDKKARDEAWARWKALLKRL